MCDLPCYDYVRILWLVKSSNIFRGQITQAVFEAYETIGCLSNGITQCSLISRPKPITCRAAFRAASYMKQYRLTVQLTESFDTSAACPFAKTSTVTDNELAFAVTESISTTYRWYEDTVVDWYSISSNYSVELSKIEIEVFLQTNRFQV